MNLELCEKIVLSLLPETDPTVVKEVFDMMRIDSLRTFDAGMQTAQDEKVDIPSFIKGMLSGVSLALTTSEPKNIPILQEAIRTMKGTTNGELRSISGASSGDGGDIDGGDCESGPTEGIGYLH